MDMDQYMGVFVAECRELIESLNLSIVALERTPDDAATIDEIFRVAHSFKGISSTMGFDLMAGLTHEMEHLLDIVRSGGRAADEELVTVLLGCLDLLEASIDGIERDGAEGIDPSALVAQLRGLSHGSGGEAPVTADAPRAEVQLPDPTTLPEGLDLLHVRVDVDPACDSASIRAYMAYMAVEALTEPLWSAPSAEDLDEWEQPHVDLLVARESGELADALRTALAKIPELASIRVEPWGAASDDAVPPMVAAVVVPVSTPAPDPAPDAEPAVVSAPASAPPTAEPLTAGAAAGTVKQRKGGTVRVDAARLDALMHLMGEVVVHRSAVETCIRDQDLAAAAEAVQELRRSTQSLQAEVMNVRMVPVETALVRLPRLVRDLSSRLGKQVDIAITGAETEIDRSVVDALGEPLVHLVRNALDHGIEGPDEREAAGKPRTATLGIGARHSGGNVIITVSDDGRGIDAERVKARAVERGIITPAEAAALDERGAVELVFRPGFSTAEVATDVSGRGVGMDAVRTMCREWGGDVEIESHFGTGSVARIRIPLTLAVMTVLVVRAGIGNVAIPIDRIERTIRLVDNPRVELGGGQRMIHLDEGVLTEFDLGAAVGYGDCVDARFGVLVHGAGERRVVLAVDGLVGEHEAVTKPLPRGLGEEAAFMGAAVQGDGSVVLIVDCDHLVEGGERPAPAALAAVAGSDEDGRREHA
ncbi:MAG: cheA [Thermoleophilia bacterium]|nr:cheA [Thermoleophilia bacterium]